MAHPLEQLRNAVMAREHITIDAQHLIINSDTKLDRSQLTKFRSLRGRGDAYSLQTVYFQFRYRDLPYNDYLQACRHEKVAHVIAVDKRDLLNYLTGSIDNCASIVLDTEAPRRADSQPSKPLPEKAPTHEADNQVPSSQTTRQSASADVSDDYSAYRSRDRDQRSLDSVLMAKDWDFTSLREKLANYIFEAKNSTKQNDPNQKGERNAYDPRGDRYTSNEGRFWRENLGSDFHDLGIDMSGSFKAKASQNAGTPPENKRTRQEPRRPSSRDAPAAKRHKVDPKRAIPLIVVPAGKSALICAANALEFLENGRFLSEEELRKKNIPLSQPGRIPFVRKPGGMCSQAEYHIISNPNRLSKEEWEQQVVAVICTGQYWQFDHWPIYNNSTADFFRKVQGFYFQYDDLPSAGDVDSWPVKALGVSRERRHTDGQLHAQFWNSLDAFLNKKRKPLRY